MSNLMLWINPAVPAEFEARCVEVFKLIAENPGEVQVFVNDIWFGADYRIAVNDEVLDAVHDLLDLPPETT